MAYVFSRSTDSVKPDYGGIAQSGATLALNSEDPNLAQAMADARAAGTKVAIWIPAHQGQDPGWYGQHMASLVQQYKPDAILPNIEGVQGKSSSGGSKWSQEMMDTFQRYVPPGSVKLDVVTEAGETDFNYRPYLNFGGGVVNEAFQGDMRHGDPERFRQKLIDAGVPPDRINMLLGPGQSSAGLNNFSMYTWDDMTPTQQQAFLKNYSTNAVGGTRSTAGPTQYGPAPGGWTRYGRPTLPPAAQPSPQTAPPPSYAELPPGATNPQTKTIQTAQAPQPRTGPLVTAGFQQVTPPVGGASQFTQVQPRSVTQAGWQQVGNVPDSANPAAQAYGRARLSQHGITVKPGEDAAAMWRNYSAKIAAARAVAIAAGPTAPNDVVSLGPGSRPPVSTPPQPAATPTPTPSLTPVRPGALGTRFTRY